MSKMAWLATVVCIGMSVGMYFSIPDLVYADTGARATFLKIGLTSMGVWPLLIIYKWEWEAYQERKKDA